MRITHLLLIVAVFFTITLQTAKAEDTGVTPVVTSTMTLSEVIAAVSNSNDIVSFVGLVAKNNPQLLEDVLSYVATNNPNELFGIMQVIRDDYPDLAITTFTTITQLLANNPDLLEKINNDNEAIIAKILEQNLDVLPAAGPVTPGNNITRGLPLRLSVPASENARQSSPN